MCEQATRGISRRRFLAGAGAAGLAIRPGLLRAAASQPIHMRPIPGTAERIPAIGMGTWITFNVGEDEALRDRRTEVLRVFFAQGGGLIDSSPMYGSSEAVVGYGLRRLDYPEGLFSATKVWTPLSWLGGSQMEESEDLWGVGRFDLMQIHNLLNWDGHLETLVERKEAGHNRYIGITTSHGRRHAKFLQVMTEPPVDFVQFTYNILDREAEKRLLPMAAERGLAVIINRPFRRGALFEKFERHPLPPWAREIDCENWAQFLLKFIISHPAVTCAIPATSRVDHMRENMGALHGPLPGMAMRRRMIGYVEDL